MENLGEVYGKDVEDLVKKISVFVDRRFKSHSFDGKYAEETGFYMSPIPNVGVFLVKFPDAPHVAIAGIDLVSGDYFFKSTEFGSQRLNIYDIEGLKMEALVKMAESEWAADIGD